LNTVQAPRLAKAIDAFWVDWDAGDATAAGRLRPTLQALAEAPRVLRERLRNPAFIQESSAWLDTTAAWGKAAVAALNLLVARDAGHSGPIVARQHDLVALEAAARAGMVGGVSVQVAPSVIDVFIQRASAPDAN
jgi:hypothetical protein